MSHIANTTTAANTHANTHDAPTGSTAGTTGLGSSTHNTGFGTSHGTAQPSKTAGAFHDAKGTVKEGLGRATGAHAMAAEGRQEKMVAKEQKGAAQTQGFAQGTHDYDQGQHQAMNGSISGDRAHRTAGELRDTKGQAEQQFNRGHAY